MDTYVILRRNGWRSGEELQEAAARSTAEGERMSDDIRWIRSYVLEEGNGVGTVCIYQASSPEAIRPHAAAADLPVDEIIRGRRHRPRPAGSRAGGRLRRGDRDEEARTDPGARRAARARRAWARPSRRATFDGPKSSTAAFHDLDQAKEAGYSVRVFDLAGIDCIAQPGQGAMGVHMLNPALLDSTIDARSARSCSSTSRATTARSSSSRSSTSSSRPPGTAPRTAGALRPGVRRDSAPATATACPRSTRCTPGSGSRIRAGCSTPGTPGSTARRSHYAAAGALTFSAELVK